MPVRGDRVIQYSIKEPATSEANKTVENVATLLGIGDDGRFSPFNLLRTEYGQQPGIRNQQTTINGDQALGMTMLLREVGYSAFLEVRQAMECMHDEFGTAQCGQFVRLSYNRNAAQQVTQDDWDYYAYFYYLVPAEWHGGTDYSIHYENASLLSVNVVGVTQMKFGFGPSFFFNMNEGATIIGGAPEKLAWQWWRETSEISGSNNDALDAAKLMAEMVGDLETSIDPWLSFNPNGKFYDSWVKFSVGDADTYFTPERLFLNRQKSYAIAYRETRESNPRFFVIVPSYNYEWNDFGDFADEIKAAVEDMASSDGTLKDDWDSVDLENLKEIEKVGNQNGQNPALEQVTIYDEVGNRLYDITFRAYLGASDTLLIFGGNMPANWRELASAAPDLPSNIPPRPIDYKEDNKTPKPAEEQSFPDDEAWRKFLTEDTIRNWLSKDNPFGSDLHMQFRVNDSSSTAPIPCADGGTCGVEITQYNLEASYVLDGDSIKPWYILQLLGDSGARTMGFSYVSGPLEGNGSIFALAQDVFYQEYNNGFSNPELVFMMNARALNTPQTLDTAIKYLLGESVSP